MANTKIQIKRSSATATPTNGSLNAGELAYSYNSEILYLGTANGANVQAIGGTYYLGLINSAFTKANTASAQGMDYPYVNAATGSANSWANTVGVAGNNYTNQIGAASNTWANTLSTSDRAIANAAANSANAYTVTVGAASNTWANVIAQNWANTRLANVVATAGRTTVAWSTTNGYTNATIDLATTAVSAASYGNSTTIPVFTVDAYGRLTYAANVPSGFVQTAGGTINGDLVVSGNLTVSGLTTYTNTNTLLVGDNIITLNADIPNNAAPTENAGIEVNRGSANANSAIFWNESTDTWQLSSNIQLGSTYVNIASNTFVEGVGAAGNNYTNSVGLAGNNYTNAVGTAGNNYTNQVGAASNTWANTLSTADRAISNAAANSANAYTVTVGTAGNNYAIQVGAASNTWANAVGTAGNNYSIQIGAASNTWANVAAQNWANTRLANVVAGVGHTITWATTNGYTNATIALSTTAVAAATYGGTDQIASFTVDAYGRLTFAGNNGINVGAATAGTLPVARGGTGNTTFTANSVLIGNGTSPVWGLFSSTEGHVLQVSAAGAPQFAMLDGGSF